MYGAGAKSVTQIRLGPNRHFIHISITTPIVSALKNLNIYSFLDVLIQMAVPLLDPDGGPTSETAERRFQKRSGRFGSKTAKKLRATVYI